MHVRPCSDFSLFRKIPVILDEALRNDLILTWLPLKNLYRKSHSEVLGVMTSMLLFCGGAGIPPVRVVQKFVVVV